MTRRRITAWAAPIFAISALFTRERLLTRKTRRANPSVLKLRALIKEHRAEQPQEMARIIKDEFISFLGLSAPESDIVMILFKTM